MLSTLPLHSALGQPVPAHSHEMRSHTSIFLTCWNRLLVSKGVYFSALHLNSQEDFDQLKGKSITLFLLYECQT